MLQQYTMGGGSSELACHHYPAKNTSDNDAENHGNVRVEIEHELQISYAKKCYNVKKKCYNQSGSHT
jgi:hypothetical protein